MSHNIFGIFLLCYTILIGAMVMPVASSVSLVTLRSDEWKCSKQEQRENSHMILIGKVLIPQRNVEDVCVEYSRVAL